MPLRERERFEAMQKTYKIDYAKLLGFDTVGDQLSGSIDFQDETIDSKLGAKVGTEACSEPMTKVQN
jgi:hypothetical protein